MLPSSVDALIQEDVAVRSETFELIGNPDVVQLDGKTQVNRNDFRSYKADGIDYTQGQPYKSGFKAGSKELADACRAADVRTTGYKITKRLFDIVMSLAVIAIVVLLWPITLVVLIATAISTKGFPFYTQERVGKDGRLFPLIKLRTMVADSDDVEKYLNDEQMQQWKRERKVDSDPRITKMGAVCRKCSIDEVSQFLNVLIGQMSVVGPRPISEDELEWYSDKHKAFLLSVPQGITGWWQVGARTKASYENHARQDLELYYAGRACWKMDWEVISRTLGVMFGKNRTGR